MLYALNYIIKERKRVFLTAYLRVSDVILYTLKHVIMLSS